MADHRALGRLGWTFGAVTAAVLLTAAVVVTTHADQWPSAGAPQFMAAGPTSSSAR